MSTSFSKIAVLIADDEKMIQRLVYDVLKQLGFNNITVATSGRQAIDHIARQPFDFMISDWRMGDIDGIDVLRFLRKSPESKCPRIPVILLTGNTEANYIFTARDEGVNEYLLKPFTAEKLAQRIRAIIERPRSFVDAPGYKGPDRRYHDIPPPGGKDRRKPLKK